MDSFNGPCSHQSIPVEMDERMTSWGPDFAWLPPCMQCSGHTQTIRRPEDGGCEPPLETARSVDQRRLPDSRCEPGAAPEPRVMPRTAAPSGHAKPPHPADVWPHILRQQEPLCERDLMFEHIRGSVGPTNAPWGRSLEEAESLEPPLPLMSDANYSYHFAPRYPATRMPGPMQANCLRPYPGCPPANLFRHKNNYYHYKQDFPAWSHQEPQHRQQLNPLQHRLQLEGSPYAPHGSVPQFAPPPRDVVHEVSVDRSVPAGAGGVTREVRRTISLPEECRKVFVTYSVDIAEDIIPFIRFLTDQGFKPSIDIFDNPIRRMGITKWMDSFLNNKSVLIIVVISPKYKEDVEGGGGDDEHGLHTKYIHNQIQNEFIQQGCLNFRLVPVLFPNATKRHVPSWLQSTRIYRWPQDTQDLLLRLVREERYIIPHQGADLTLTVRPL
ncbi:E3 ubiquitin ligase TRAF3IP2 isoform X1 [Embiotoca jacksoni]|uniref:E3 ubiquitin ligase TRAF3IP2 isoform X1 n=1 Tax=Embiotoca jacksoni TaxID=100190 RepID=UPI003704CAAA